MTLFEIFLLICLMFISMSLIVLAYRGEFKIKYERTNIQETHLDDIQLELAKQNIEELKKYNENAAKNSNDTTQAIQTMTAAVQSIMGVDNEGTK